MLFGRKKLREKKFIDYVLQDIPFGLDEMFASDQSFIPHENLTRLQLLGPEKGSIENAAIATALKSARVLSILAGVAEKSNINIPDDYQLYHAIMVQDAWGARGGVHDDYGVLDDFHVRWIKMIVEKTFDDLSGYHKQKLLGFIQTIFPEIVSFEHAKAVIAIANKLTVKSPYIGRC